MSEVTVQECLNYLNIVGAHPFISNFSSSMRYIYHFSHQFITWVLLVMEMIIYWKGVETLENGAEIVIGSYQTMIKTLIMYKLRQEIIGLLEQLNRFWPLDKCGAVVHDELINVYDTIRSVYVIFRNTIITSALVVAIKPIFSAERELPVKTFEVCNIRNNFCYIFCFSWQIGHLAHMVIIVIGFDGLFFTFLTRVYCQFKMIKYGMATLYFDDLPEEALMEKTSEFVNHHNFLLRFMKNMNAVYSNFLFVQFSASLVEVCVVTFLFSLDGLKPSTYRVVKYAPLLIMLLSQIYLYCIAGDRIAEECGSVADATYECGWWTKYHPSIRKSVCLIIQRAHMQTQLSAGGLFNLDMQTFSGIVRKAGSLYMAIQQLYLDEMEEL